jgi:hypothetical protein
MHGAACRLQRGVLDLLRPTYLAAVLKPQVLPRRHLELASPRQRLRRRRLRRHFRD